MKKYIFAILSACVLTFGLQSCVDETGAGVPVAKNMYLQNAEYTVDLSADTIPLTLRWIDVTNATYEVTFSNGKNDYAEKLTNEVKTGELETLSMEIPYSQVAQYVGTAGLTPDENNNVDIDVTVKGNIINESLPSVLTTKGNTVTAIIHVKNIE